MAGLRLSFLFVLLFSLSATEKMSFVVELVELDLVASLVLRLLDVVLVETGFPSFSIASDGSWLLRVFRRRRLPEREEDTDAESATEVVRFLLFRDETLDTGTDS